MKLEVGYVTQQSQEPTNRAVALINQRQLSILA